MSNFNEAEADPHREILAGLALGNLTSEELLQLGESLGDRDSSELFELERAAAALQLALHGGANEMMPESLQRKIVEQGLQMVRPSDADAPRRSSEVTAPGVRPHTYSEVREKVTALANGSRISAREILAWATCAAAIFVAIGIWQLSRPAAGSNLTLAQARTKFLSEAVDLIRVAWADGKTPLGQVNGDVVWSNVSQTGFMRFVNLPANDPTKEQYQLWIIDPARDDEPIDGGVFDVTTSGEVIVPIQAKLKVLKPAAFAITIEKPGGVVVSTQERLPLLAVVK